MSTKSFQNTPLSAVCKKTRWKLWQKDREQGSLSCLVWCCELENHLGYEITASFKSKLKADGLVYKMALKFGKPPRSLRSVSQQFVSI